MSITLGKVVGLATFIGLYVCSCFYIISALKCYKCVGEEACKKENLGKNGSDGTFPNGTEKEYGISECKTTGLELKGSEMCIAVAGDKGILKRGCRGFPMEKRQLFNKSEINICHLEDGSNWAKQSQKLLCACFTDFCNGDPPTCCDYKDGVWSL